MVAGLRNVDDELAAHRGRGPWPARAARAGRAGPAAARRPAGLAGAEHPQRKPPGSFAGRKLGVLLTDGADAETLAALRAAAAARAATVELIAPAVGGVDVSDGTRVRADQQIDGAPSVLYDAVAILASPAAPARWRRARRPGTS